MKFVFFLLPQRVEGSTYMVPTVERYARTVELAFESARQSIPEGHRMWCWVAEPEHACTMCGGPFHPATGHWESEKRHWCGPCAKDMYAFLKATQPRRWGGLRFYDYAFPPPAMDTSAADLAADQ